MVVNKKYNYFMYKFWESFMTLHNFKAKWLIVVSLNSQELPFDTLDTQQNSTKHDSIQCRVWNLFQKFHVHSKHKCTVVSTFESAVLWSIYLLL